MKPSPFVYHRPTTLEESLEVLAEVGADGKVLAGGQSLVPLMSMRLATPAHLVDINHVDGLDRIETDDGGVRVGATSRHAAVERDPAAFAAVPLLRQALVHVAHPTIRNRGTTVGSLAHADPSGEMTAVLAMLGGTVTLASRGNERTVDAADFFLGPLESAVRPDEVAVEAFFPAPEGRTGSAWVEVSRRHGDYAVCGVGALVSLDDDLHVTAAGVGLISVGPTPVVVDVTEALAGQAHDTADVVAAGALVRAAVDPEADIHATAEYRRHLAGTLTERALQDAASAAAAHDGRGDA
ncbi:MAG TPA: xanthine dehydrogenase family protein subunit M [Jiangellaceae bacterium]